MSTTIGGTVDRLYKNAAGEILRIDTVSMYGWVIRKNTYTYKREIVDGQRNWGDWIFHSNGGRKVGTELFHLGGARTVAEIELMGSW